MGFLDSLKKVFTYTGEVEPTLAEKAESSVKPDKTSVKNLVFGVRKDVTNTLNRLKDSKELVVTEIQDKLNLDRTDVISEETKDVIYQALYNKVESAVKKNKPFVETRLLFKRFLEEEVVEEEFYSDDDLVYIKSLVKCLQELKDEASTSTAVAADLITEVIDNPNILEMVELLDKFYCTSMYDYIVKSSYVLCGVGYSHDSLTSIINRAHVPVFFLCSYFLESN